MTSCCAVSHRNESALAKLDGSPGKALAACSNRDNQLAGPDNSPMADVPQEHQKAARFYEEQRVSDETVSYFLLFGSP